MRPFGDPRRRGWASDHERARQRAAERLSLPLPAAEETWLKAHLAACPACARVASQYDAQRERLRRLRPIDPPRDLWARTSAALDRVERELAGRELPASAARQRGQRRAVRSIRALRAEQHASALGRMTAAGRGRFAEARRSRGQGRAGNPRWAFPFATLAALTLVVATGGLLLNGNPRNGGLAPAESAGTGGSAGPGATPITITTTQVAWLSPNLSGGYSLTMASVDQVCPDDARHDCAPIEGTQEQVLPSFSAQPAAVVRSPANGHLMVVDRSAKSRGGSVYVVAMPAAVATPEPSAPAATTEPRPTDGQTASPTPIAPSAAATTPPASADASPSPSDAPPPATSDPSTPEPTSAPGGPTPEPGATSAPSGQPDPTGVPSPDPTAPASDAPSGAPSPGTDPVPSAEPVSGATDAPGMSAEPSPSPALEPSSVPSPLASPEPSMAAAIAIISDVVLVGESAAYSADGSMFAFSARPADGSHGPDIYLWRTGDAQAHPITSDHGSIFSGWVGNLVIGSRAVADVIPSTPSPDASAPTDDGSDGQEGNIGSGAVQGESPGPEPSSEPALPAEPAASESPAGAAGAAGASVSAGSAGGFAAEAAVALALGPIRETGAARTLLVPVTAMGAVPGAGQTTPSLAPSSDPSPEPSPGASADPSVPTGAEPSADPSADPSGPVVTEPGPVESAVPFSFLIDPATGVESVLSATPAWRPVVDPSGRLVVYWSGTLRYDPDALTWLPDEGRLHLAPWPEFSSPSTGEVPAVPLFDDPPDTPPTRDWDARWDDDGDRIAVWRADPDDPAIGRLSLLAVDAASGAPVVLSMPLRDEPALPGFSIDGDHLAWATPPGQDGEGSRIQVLAWSGEHAGQIVSQPTSGDGAIIVVR